MSPEPPSMVLDTNAILDAWVFKDPHMQRLEGALRAASVRWLATTAMREELKHTLAKASLTRWQPDVAQVLANFDGLARLVQPPAAIAAGAPVCRDANDQMFIDLALAHRCRWLVTHDKALLALRRRARAQGLLVMRPAEWVASKSGAA